jgi:hypothetical protein
MALINQGTPLAQSHWFGVAAKQVAIDLINKLLRSSAEQLTLLEDFQNRAKS